MIKKAFLFSLIAIMLLAVPALALVTYEAPYTITENASVSYDMLPAIGLAENQWMADNGFMNSSANDTRIETLGGLERPHLVTDNMTLTAVSVPANSQTNLYFTTGGSELSAMDIITGRGGYITTADNATIELSDNFTIGWKGWVDTDNGTDKYLVDKRPVFSTEVSDTVSGNITSSIGVLGNFVSPTGSEDPSVAWSDDSKIFDDNTGTFAYEENIPVGAWSEYIVATFDEVDISGCRAWQGHGDYTTVDINIYYGGSYHDGYEGAMAVGGWVNFEIWGEGVTKIQFRWKNDGADAFSEPSFYECDYRDVGSISISATGVSSGEHTVKTTQQPVLYFDGGDVVTVPHHSSINITDAITILAWVNLEATGTNDGIIDKKYSEAYGLYKTAGDTTINWRMMTSTGNLVISNGNLSNDEWQFIGGTYDSSTGLIVAYVEETSASTNGAGTIETSAETLLIGNCHVVGIGLLKGLVGEVWIYNRALSATEVAERRNGIFSDNTGLVGHWRLDEASGTIAFDSSGEGNTGTITGAGYWGNEMLSLYVDDTLEDVGDGESVPDNSNDWTFLQNDVMPYAEYMTFEIDGVEQLRYEPVSMIIGTALPDRAGTAQNGVITWGTNPTGIAVVLGSMVSEEQPTPDIVADEPAQDILPHAEVTDWYIEPAVGGALLTNPLRPFVTMLSDNSTLTEIQSWRLLGIALVLMVTVATARGVGKHQGITMIAAGCGFGALVALTIFPMWALVFAIGMFIGGLVMERAPSL